MKNENIHNKIAKLVKIQDLIEEPDNEFDNSRLVKNFSGKTILITGAAGSVGSELALQIVKYGCETVILLDQSESGLYDLQQQFYFQNIKNIIPIVADVRNSKRLDFIFKKYTPHIVFHAAAYKHVPLMEDNAYEAIAVNIAGTVNVANLSVTHDVQKFVFISTDKAVHPTSVMGATKKAAENYIKALNSKSNTKFVVTRFGNVMGSSGSVIPLFQSQILKGGPLTVTHKDADRYFMTIAQACQLVLDAVVLEKGGGYFVFKFGKPKNIYELAKTMIQLSGLDYPTDIDIKIIGLRPGEKIKEQFLATGETILETAHPQLLKIVSKDVDVSETLKNIKELCLQNENLESNSCVALLKESIPEFVFQD